MPLSCTIDFFYRISGMRCGLEVDKSIIHPRLGEPILIRTIFISIGFEASVCVIVITITASKNIAYTSLLIFHIGRGCGDNRFCLSLFIGCIGWIIDFLLHIVTDTIQEVFCIQNTSSQIVTTKDVVTNPGETTSISVGSIIIRLTADIGLSMS